MIRALTLFSILLCVMGLSKSYALPDEAAFGVAQNSRAWQQAELEEWLVVRITKDISQFVSPEYFKVYANVEYKNLNRSGVRSQSINLPMLGTVATITSHERSRPEMGIFDKIAKVDVTLIVSEHVQQSTVDAMTMIMKKKVPVIDQSRVETNVVRVERPQMGFVDWLKEFKWTIALVLVFGMLMYGLSQLLQKVKFRGAWHFGPLHAAKNSIVNRGADFVQKFRSSDHESQDSLVAQSQAVAPAASGDRPNSMAAAASNHVAVSNDIAAHAKAISKRGFENWLNVMSVRDLIKMSKSDAELAAVVALHATKDKSARVMQALTLDEKKSVMELSQKWSQVVPTTLEAALTDKIRTFHAKIYALPTSHDDLLKYFEAAGLEQAESIYAELLTQKDHTLFKSLAQVSLPMDLLQQVPQDCVKAVVSQMPYSDRVDVLAFGPFELQTKIWNALPESLKKTEGMMRAEVKRMQSESNVHHEAAMKSLWRFANKIRMALRTNKVWSQEMESHVSKWVESRIRSAKESGHGKKVA